MKFLIVNLLVAVAFFQDGLAGSIQLYAGDSDIVNCQNVSGSTCGNTVADCGSVFLCIPNIAKPLKATCDTGLTCNAGSCSSVKSPFCEYGLKKFKCSTLGMYPEPSSCKKFHFCVPTTASSSGEGTNTAAPPVDPFTSISMECETGWGYNSVTTSCDKPLRDNKCAAQDRPVPACLTIGQTGTLKDNPTMYYICMPYDDDVNSGLYPSIFKCPRNTKYAGKYVCK